MFTIQEGLSKTRMNKRIILDKKMMSKSNATAMMNDNEERNDDHNKNNNYGFVRWYECKKDTFHSHTKSVLEFSVRYRQVDIIFLKGIIHRYCFQTRCPWTNIRWTHLTFVCSIAKIKNYESRLKKKWRRKIDTWETRRSNTSRYNTVHRDEQCDEIIATRDPEIERRYDTWIAEPSPLAQ